MRSLGYATIVGLRMSNIGRKVHVMKYGEGNKENNWTSPLAFDYDGWFLDWGLGGDGHCAITIALIQMADGTVKGVPPGMIKFATHMDWRQNMRVKPKNEHFHSYPQYPQYPH